MLAATTTKYFNVQQNLFNKTATQITNLVKTHKESKDCQVFERMNIYNRAFLDIEKIENKLITGDIVKLAQAFPAFVEKILKVEIPGLDFVITKKANGDNSYHIIYNFVMDIYTLKYMVSLFKSQLTWGGVIDDVIYHPGTLFKVVGSVKPNNKYSGNDKNNIVDTHHEFIYGNCVKNSLIGNIEGLMAITNCEITANNVSIFDVPFGTVTKIPVTIGNIKLNETVLEQGKFTISLVDETVKIANALFHNRRMLKDIFDNYSPDAEFFSTTVINENFRKVAAYKENLKKILSTDKPITDFLTFYEDDEEKVKVKVTDINKILYHLVTGTHGFFFSKSDYTLIVGENYYLSIDIYTKLKHQNSYYNSIIQELENEISNITTRFLRDSLAIKPTNLENKNSLKDLGWNKIVIDVKDLATVVQDGVVVNNENPDGLLTCINKCEYVSHCFKKHMTDIIFGNAYNYCRDEDGSPYMDIHSTFIEIENPVEMPEITPVVVAKRRLRGALRQETKAEFAQVEASVRLVEKLNYVARMRVALANAEAKVSSHVKYTPIEVVPTEEDIVLVEAPTQVEASVRLVEKLNYVARKRVALANAEAKVAAPIEETPIKVAPTEEDIVLVEAPTQVEEDIVFVENFVETPVEKTSPVDQLQVKTVTDFVETPVEKTSPVDQLQVKTVTDFVEIIMNNSSTITPEELLKYITNIINITKHNEVTEKTTI